MTGDTYRIGMAVVIEVLCVIVTLIAALDTVADFRGWPNVTEDIDAWTQKNPWLARALVLFLFVLLAHFVLNPLPRG